MIRVGVVGYGYWGRNIARDLSELGALAALVDPDPRAAEAGSAALSVRAASFEGVIGRWLPTATVVQN